MKLVNHPKKLVELVAGGGGDGGGGRDEIGRDNDEFTETGNHLEREDVLPLARRRITQTTAYSLAATYYDPATGEELHADDVGPGTTCALVPPAPAPTGAPTPAPTPHPTPAPTRAPTRSPTGAPTQC